MRRRTTHRARTAALCGLAAIAASVAAVPLSANPLDASIRHLRLAVKGQRDGSHLGMLSALRQLRDPELALLFQRLLEHGEWQVQVHAVLGLAEIHPSQLIEPDHVARIAPLAQEAVVASALDLRLLAAVQIPKLLEYPDLHPMARLLLHAERSALGMEVDREELRGLSEHNEFRIAALASLLLAQSGERGGLERLHEQARRQGRAGQRQILWLLDAVRQYRLTATEQWIRSLLDEPNLDREIIDTAVFSAVTLDPAKNIDLWHRALGANAPLARRVRYGLMLLNAGREVPASAYARVAGDDELTIRLANAGRATSSGAGASSAIIELLNFGHVRSMEWAVDAAGGLSHDEARRVYLHVLDRLMESDRAPDSRGGGPRAEWVASGIKAAAKLCEIDPDAAHQKLLATEPAGQARQALLLGMLDSRAPSAGEAARSLDLTGFGLPESIALLLIARHSEQLTKEELTRLGLIASGGGRLSDDLRAQAAWLYIKRSGNADTAISRVFNEEEGSRR